MKPLDSIIDLIFQLANEKGLSNQQLARRAKLCIQTVDRLDNYKTRYPRLKTVFSLAKAVGLEFVLKRRN